MSHEGNDWIFEKQHEEEIERMANKFQVIVDAIEAMKEDSFFDRMYYTVQRLGRVQGKNYVDAELQHLQNFIRKVEKEY